jgi:branched-chain amino acid aminotransferase
MEPTQYIWKDGELIGWDDATIHVLSHGLHYGTGAFEGIRVYETDRGPAVFRPTEHMERLARSCRALSIPVDWTADELANAAKELFAANGLRSGYIRPIVFYGVGSMDLNPSGVEVHTFIACFGFGPYLGEDGVEHGITVTVSSWRRITHDSLMPNAKITGGYVNSVLAIQEAVRGGYDEAIMLNADGFVAEGSGENLFVVRDGAVTTPPLATGVLEGVTRSTVMTLLEEDGHPVDQHQVTRTDLYYADEIFLTGTAAEVTPVREVDDHPVGEGKPGRITRLAQERFMAAATGRDERHADWLEYV